MSREKTTATVVVRLTVEVPVNEVWGGDCSVEQAYRQGLDEAKDRVSRLLQEDTMGRATGVRIVNTECVNVVMSRGRER